MIPVVFFNKFQTNLPKPKDSNLNFRIHLLFSESKKNLIESMLLADLFQVFCLTFFGTNFFILFGIFF